MSGSPKAGQLVAADADAGNRGSAAEARSQSRAGGGHEQGQDDGQVDLSSFGLPANFASYPATSNTRGRGVSRGAGRGRGIGSRGARGSGSNGLPTGPRAPGAAIGLEGNPAGPASSPDFAGTVPPSFEQAEMSGFRGTGRGGGPLRGRGHGRGTGGAGGGGMGHTSHGRGNAHGSSYTRGEKPVQAFFKPSFLEDPWAHLS